MRHATNDPNKRNIAVSEGGGSVAELRRGDEMRDPKAEARDGEIVASAVDADAKPTGPVKFYRVTKGGPYADPYTRARTTLRIEKEIDSRNYDVKELRKQGILTEEIPDPRFNEALD